MRLKTTGIIVLSLLSLIMTVQSLPAQNLIGFGEGQYDEFYYRVKQFSEFSDRFNYRLDRIGGELSEEDKAKLSREVLLVTLFNQEDPRFDPGGSAFSQEYLELITAFINKVCEEKIYLDPLSENIYARAICEGSYKGQKTVFSIILKQEKAGKGIKWVMRDMEADFLDFLEEDSIMLRFLPPTSDELDFMELRRALSDSTHLDAYSHRDFSYDPLSVFFYLKYIGEIKVETVREVEYIIRDIPGFIFTLHDYNRSSENSGWLIKDLQRNNN